MAKRYLYFLFTAGLLKSNLHLLTKIYTMRVKNSYT